MAKVREDDPLLNYAYIPSEVKKIYAHRFVGRINDLPYVFAKRIVESFSARATHEEVNVKLSNINGQDQLSPCKQGDWIVVDMSDPDETLAYVFHDEEFRKRYTKVHDLSFE